MNVYSIFIEIFMLYTQLKKYFKYYLTDKKYIFYMVLMVPPDLEHTDIVSPINQCCLVNPDSRAKVEVS